MSESKLRDQSLAACAFLRVMLVASINTSKDNSRG